MDLCDLTDAEATRAGREVEDLATRGYRTLAVASREGGSADGRDGAEGPWRLLGLLPLSDPPRDDAA